jgi:hypothetical protein
LLKNDGTLFDWPASTIITASPEIKHSAGETPSNMLDHSVNTKVCGTITTPFSFIFDVGESNAFNINDISNWQWWTANDTAS